MRSRESTSTHYPRACHPEPTPHVPTQSLHTRPWSVSFIPFKVQEGQAEDLTNPENLNSQLWEEMWPVDSEPKRGTIPVETGTFSQ